MKCWRHTKPREFGEALSEPAWVPRILAGSLTRIKYSNLTNFSWKIKKGVVSSLENFFKLSANHTKKHLLSVMDRRCFLFCHSGRFSVFCYSTVDGSVCYTMISSRNNFAYGTVPCATTVTILSQVRQLVEDHSREPYHNNWGSPEYTRTREM